MQPSGYTLLDGVVLDAKGNIYVSEMLRNEIGVQSPDRSQRILIVHSKPEEADRTVVCMKGFAVPK